MEITILYRFILGSIRIIEKKMESVIQGYIGAISRSRMPAL